MKTKILLLWCLMAIAGSGFAQLNLGDAVTTNSGLDCGYVVVKIFDVQNPVLPPPITVNNWGLNFKTVCNGWTLGALGQVFGTAINPNAGNPLIYVSNTQIYYRSNCIAPLEYPETYPAGTTLIWELNPVTGAANPLVTSITTPGFTATGIYNTGAGLGNICYDPDNNQIFATNFEDGRIYRIKVDPSIPANNGQVLSRYDPFETHTPSTVKTIPPFVDRRERLWGIGYNRGVANNTSDNVLYFAKWQEDLGSSCSDGNEIWSIPLDAGGDFDLPGTANDYTDPSWTPLTPISSSTLVIGAATLPLVTIPPIATETCPYSNPVADIEFSSDGNIMLLAERTMDDVSPMADPVAFCADPLNRASCYAHRSRVLRYDRTNTISNWTASLNKYFVGNHLANTNCDGGVDLGYDPVSEVPNCEALVWATGDALKHTDAASTWGLPEFVYGIAGIPIGGNSIFDNSTPPLDAVNVSSYYVDIFNPGGSPTWEDARASKTRPGDVDIFRSTCCEPLEVMVNPLEPCEGQTVTIGVTGGLAPYTYVWSDSYAGGSPRPNISMGSYTVDVTDANGCTGSVSFEVEMCEEDGCPVIILDIAHTAPVGTTYTFFNDFLNPFPDLNPDNGNGTSDPMITFIKWSVNGEVQKQTIGTEVFVHSFEEEGTYVVCMEAGYVIPHDGHSECCYYDDCEVIHVRGCELWQATNDFIVTYSPSDYHDVTVDYTGFGDELHPSDTWITTIIWDFGDGTVEVSDGVTEVAHTYLTDGPFTITAHVVWSIGPWDGSNPEACCCVDEISKEFSQCQTYALSIVSMDPLTYEVVPAPSGSTNWFVSGQSQGSSVQYVYSGPPCDGCVCAQFTSENETPCIDVCNTAMTSIMESRVMGYYPNPTSGIMTVEIESKLNEQAVVEIFDFMGRSILSKRFENLKTGKTQLPISLADMSRGLYQMKVAIGDETKVVKVIKD